MPAKYAWAFENPNKNISDRVLRVQVAISKPAGRLSGRGAAAWEEMQHQVADDCKVAFELPVNSLMLAGASDLFRVELERYSNPGEPLVMTVEDGQQDLMYTLIRFTYTNKLAVDDADVLLRLLLLAQQVTIDKCVSKCAQALSEPGRLSFEVALEICQLATQQECLGDMFDKLYKLAADMILDKFRDLDAVLADEERRKAFLDLPLPAVKVLLGHAELQVRSENTVFLMTAHWLEFPKGRLDSFAELNALIRWSQMTSSFMRTVFCKVPWLAFWEDADRVQLDALYYKQAHDAAKKAMHSASPELAPRPRPAGSDEWTSLVVKIPESDLQRLDEFLVDGVGTGTLVCNQGLHVAGYEAQLELDVCDRGKGRKGVAVFMQLGVALPHQRLDPSDLAMVVYSWAVTTGGGIYRKRLQHVSCVQEASKQRLGRWLVNVHLASGDGQGAPVTRALRNVGYLKDGALELSWQVSCAT